MCVEADRVALGTWVVDSAQLNGELEDVVGRFSVPNKNTAQSSGEVGTLNRRAARGLRRSLFWSVPRPRRTGADLEVKPD